MTGAEVAMAAGDVIALASLATSWVVSKKTKDRLNAAKRCPACGGRNAGYIHFPECTGTEQKR